MRIHHHLLAIIVIATNLLAPAARAEERFITVASTTSTEQSGLFGYLLPAFEQANRQRIEPGDAEKSLEGAGGVDETRRGGRGEENRAVPEVGST